MIGPGREFPARIALKGSEKGCYILQALTHDLVKPSGDTTALTIGRSAMGPMEF